MQGTSPTRQKPTPAETARRKKSADGSALFFSEDG
jgi:hypothetical protein